MKKIYESKGKDKKDIIECENEYRAFLRYQYDKADIGIKDLIMIGKVKEFPKDSHVNIHWNLNGLKKSEQNEDEIIIIEPLNEQIYNGTLEKLTETDTYFNEPIELSEKAIILMSIKKYEELSNYSELKEKIDGRNIRIYDGEEELGLEMIFFDKNFIYIEHSEEGYLLDQERHPDTIGYIEIVKEKQKEIEKEFVGFQKNTEKAKHKIKLKKDMPKSKYYKVITGLTEKNEGDLSLDDEMYATTDIGKTRENQEDAVLLVKDKDISDFKMMVIADGMGGWQNGEIASDIIVKKMKEWFENLNEKEKQSYYTEIKGLQESLFETIQTKIQPAVEFETMYLGGSTLVCAIIGKNETLIANIGDSRAYIIKDGKLKQISREDTIAQENLRKGKTPDKEASRFDQRSNELTQCLGMNKKLLKYPHCKILNNNEYDMLLLFSDGVTDCLSDDDIAVICKNSNRKEVCKKIVEKAIRHDSIEPDEYMDITDLNIYIPGGKDNTTATVYVPNNEEYR